ncbi:MAG: hypothetical protein HOQ21_14460 [Dermatophilaceae bacterium]|nr:hypothetical protein [Dermatophilaceae bacterium]
MVAVTAQPGQRADLDLIEALDFEPEYACEWLKRGEPCGEPAVYLVGSRKTCPCPNHTITTCADCWDGLGNAMDGGCWHCAHCEEHVGRTRDEVFEVVCHLKGRAA